MKEMKKFRGIVLLAMLATSCTRLETFMSKKPEGSEFDKRLVEHYQEFARSEAEQCDWASSRRFINKGMALLHGEEIEPERLKLWNLPKESLPELIEARKELIKILEDEKILEDKPIAAAKAMYSFDCWVEEQAENWQEEEIKACKDGFYNALTEINNPTPLPPVAIPVVENQIEPQKPKLEAIDESKRIYFGYDSYILSKENVEKIEKIATEISNMGDEVIEIHLNGHTDRFGPEWYNVELSRKRAIEVQKLLEKLKINKEKIKVFALGYTKPIIEDLKNLKEPKNRRVEIILLDK